MRLDKFLKISHILKRRTVANEACVNGRVVVNGKPAKPSLNVKVDDVVEIKFSDKPFSFKILKILEHVKKEEAENMYQIL